MDNEHCYHHGYEPIPENVYRVCGECFHAFATREEMLEAHKAIAFDLDLQWEDDEVLQRIETFCPLCLHDF